MGAPRLELRSLGLVTRALTCWVVSHRPQVNWSFQACLGYCSWSEPASFMNAALSQQGKVLKGNWRRSVTGSSSAAFFGFWCFLNASWDEPDYPCAVLDVRQGNLTWDSFRASSVLTCPVNTTKGCSLPTRRVGRIQSGKKGWKHTVVGTKHGALETPTLLRSNLFPRVLIPFQCAIGWLTESS